jgi:predicted outer membrane protein
VIGRTIAAAALFALIATTAPAEPAGKTPDAPTTVAPALARAAPRATRAKDRPDEVVCRRMAISGTRVLGPKTCLARREWKAMEGRGMEEIEAAIRASRTTNCAGC